ncbi:hypothetical protein M9H77_02012 [Catharanthus roseus]|uniref:Uncharacterized protein n=1 Tax=Catharanthus roseus TaxID=4058 RepID=A0ACC0C7B8_CATRO|nr:hypothetical protein M9H77_02012 [Catharanthus roseus]
MGNQSHCRVALRRKEYSTWIQEVFRLARGTRSSGRLIGEFYLRTTRFISLQLHLELVEAHSLWKALQPLTIKSDVYLETDEAKDLLLDPFTRARANGMDDYMEKALKNKLEEFEARINQGNKLEVKIDEVLEKPLGRRHPTASGGSPPPSLFKVLNRGSSRKGGDPWEGVESKLQSKVDLHQSGIRETSHWLRSSKALETTSRPLNYNNLKLPLLCGTFGPYDYEAWEQKVESLFYIHCVREEEKFQLVLKYLPYEVKVWWNSRCENGRRMGLQPIKTWSLMKQSLRNRFGFGNHKEQRKVQPKVKFMESLMVEELPKIKELSEDKIEESLRIHIVEETSKEEPCCIMNVKSTEIKENEQRVNILSVQKRKRVILRKAGFEQVCKDFVVQHLYYHIPFKEWFSKLFISFASLQKNSSALTLKL